MLCFVALERSLAPKHAHSLTVYRFRSVLINRDLYAGTGSSKIYVHTRSRLPMSTKGQKNLRGRPEKWDELKRRYTMTLTPTGAGGLDALAATLGLNRSELVERIGRGIIPIHPDTLDSSRGTL